jgi:hypothetical protein
MVLDKGECFFVFLSRAAILALDIARGMAYLHSQRVVHRVGRSIVVHNDSLCCRGCEGWDANLKLSKGAAYGCSPL